jgi:uncharacterized protein involved in outer membrane biogenesis
VALKHALKWLAIGVLGLLAAVIVAGISAVFWIDHADLHALVEREASKSLGRQIRIGSLQVSLGDPIRVEMHDLHLPNTPWGSRPDMLTIESASARIAVRPLLHGVLQYDQLRVEKLSMILERDKSGTGNWKFGGGSAPTFGHIALIPKNRGEFPTIIDGTLADSEIDYRTSSGKILKIDLAKTLILTTGDDQPVTLSADGASNDIPAHLKAGTAAFSVMRDESRPFPANYSIVNDNVAVNFRGTIMQPLDYDGVEGKLIIEARDIGRLMKVFDAEVSSTFPVSLTGDLKHDGDDWNLAGITGKLADNTLTGMLALKEGARGGGDRISISANFAQLDLDSLIGAAGKQSQSTDIWATPLDLPGAKAPDLSARIVADHVKFKSWRVADLKLSGEMAPAKATIENLQFAFAGARTSIHAKAEPRSGATHLEADGAVAGADAAQMAAMLGAQRGEIGGKIDGRFTMAMTGKTLGDGLSAGQGSAVVTMREGTVARDLLEKSSTDLRTLFRKGEGRSHIECLLAVAVLQNGIARVQPLSLRTPDANLNGGGTVDLKRKRLDLTVKSDPHSTGFFALDIPLRVAGPFGHLTAGTTAKSGLAENPPLPKLPDAMRDLVVNSGCLRH